MAVYPKMPTASNPLRRISTPVPQVSGVFRAGKRQARNKRAGKRQ